MLYHNLHQFRDRRSERLCQQSCLALVEIKDFSIKIGLQNITMSKVFVYVLDKVVWMLLIAALTTQALQIAGIIETPKGLQEITYTKGNEYNFQLSVGSENRGKRETAERSQLIDSLFNIPIQTLTAVNNLVQNSRPAIRGIRDYAVKRFMKSRTTTTTTESPESNLHKRSYPVYVRPKEDEEKYNVNNSS